MVLSMETLYQKLLKEGYKDGGSGDPKRALEISIHYLFETEKATEVRIFEGKTLDPNGFKYKPTDYVLFYK